MRLVEGEGKRILVLGAGSAGLAAALTLKGATGRMPGTEVILLSRTNYHFILPLIYQVVTGSLAPPHVCFPVRPLLRGSSNGPAVSFRQGTVSAIDPQSRTVSTDGGDLHYDYLLLALGSTTNFFGTEGAEEHSHPFKSVGDAIDLHNRIVDSYEAALLETDERERRRMLTFVVVGGGPTGVELAASIHDLTAKVMARDYPPVASESRVILVEARERLLGGLNPKSGEKALKGLRLRGVEVMLDTKVNRVSGDSIDTAAGERIPTGTVVWVAGTRAPDLVRGLPFEKVRDGRIVTNESLEVPGWPGVYVAGDSAYIEQPGRSTSYPPTHQVAIQMGPACARNIVRVIRGEAQRPFRYWFKGQMVYMGRNMAVADLFGQTLDGLTASMVRRSLYVGQSLMYLGPLTSLRVKTSAMVDWVFSYFYNRNVARIG